MSEDDIKEVRITNPIILGESIDSKQMWLDVNVILNNYIIINLEMHIGFLDFSLERAEPEFYATYKLANVKTRQIYSDNVTLCVVDLNKTELATDEDIRYRQMGEAFQSKDMGGGKNVSGGRCLY